MTKNTKELESVESSIEGKIRSKLETIIEAAKKFDEGNNSAGTRVRTGLQDIKVSIKEIRDLVQEIKTSRK